MTLDPTNTKAPHEHPPAACIPARAAGGPTAELTEKVRALEHLVARLLFENERLRQQLAPGYPETS